MQGLRMLISLLDTQPLYESCWLQRKCHQLSEMQQHIAQTYVPEKPETCYCMCEGAVTNTVRETLCVLHWTPTMCFCAFYSPAGLQDCVSACSCGERSQAWVELNRVTPLLPCSFPILLEPFSSLNSDSFTLKHQWWLKDWVEEESDTVSFRYIVWDVCYSQNDKSPGWGRGQKSWGHYSNWTLTQAQGQFWSLFRENRLVSSSSAIGSSLNL